MNKNRNIRAPNNPGEADLVPLCSRLRWRAATPTSCYSCPSAWRRAFILQQLAVRGRPHLHGSWLPHTKSFILPNGCIFPESVCLGKKREQGGRLGRKRIGEAAKIHYLSVLYLSHMLLLSNLSPQILDSENKQRDHSLSVSEAAQARGRGATRRPAAGRGSRAEKARRRCRSSDKSSGIHGSSKLFLLLGWILFFGPRCFDPLNFYSPPSSPHFKGGLEFIPDNPAQFRKWNDEDSVKCGIMDGLPNGKNRITIIRFK